jgi:DNA polymerase gamma 1
MNHIKLMPEAFHQRLLGRGIIPQSGSIALECRQLATDLEVTDESEVICPVLPEWLGTTGEMLEQATETIGGDVLERYHRLSTLTTPDRPPAPESRQGWVYFDDGRWVPCAPPDKVTAVLDFETVEHEGFWYPVCCVGLAIDGWYCWVADIRAIGTGNGARVIPFGKRCALVGHNVSYDRQYLESEYDLADTGNRFFDTMGAHILCNGMGNQQRSAYNAMAGSEYPAHWMAETATNGLDAVYTHYVGGYLSKGVRDELVNGGYKWLQEPGSLERLLMYCFEDVRATHEVYKALYPQYLSHVPDKAQRLGHLLIGSSWVPLSADRWASCYENAEREYQRINRSVGDELRAAYTQFCDRYVSDFQAFTVSLLAAKADLGDPIAAYVAELPMQVRSLDWAPARSGKTKGLPAWYRATNADLTLKSKIAPIVLGVTYMGEPICCRPAGKSWAWFTASQGYLPHPDGNEFLSNPFVKGNLKAFEAGTYASANGCADLLAKIASCINWQSMRARVASIHTEAPKGYPVTIPQVIATGTITGRATDKAWLVFPNPKEKRVGTEVKSMIEAPPGYLLIGADQDSQELWLGACLADRANGGYVGSTPLSLMVIAGDSSKGTDFMSVVAKQAGTKRQEVKARVYGGFYGQGRKGDIDVLRKANPGQPEEWYASQSAQFLSAFKGARGDRGWAGGLASQAFNGMAAIADSRTPRTPVTNRTITRVLQNNKEYATTRQNWVIQASGADMRDLWVVLVLFYFRNLEIDGRLCLTLHDEARFIVRESHATQAVYALQLANATIRAHFIDRMGLDNIPAGIIWHGSVDVDKVLRKEPNAPCVTPSQPTPIPPGYGVDIKDLVKLVGSA